MTFRLLVCSLLAALTMSLVTPIAYSKTEAECLEDIRLGTELIKSSPNDFRGYASRGCAFGYLKKYDLAEKDILKALSLKPGTAGLYSHLASAYHGMGRYEDAIKACRKSIEFGHRTQAAYNALLGSLYEAKHFEVVGYFGCDRSGRWCGRRAANKRSRAVAKGTPRNA